MRRAPLVQKLKAEVAAIVAHYRKGSDKAPADPARADRWQAALDGALAALEAEDYTYEFKVSVE